MNLHQRAFSLRLLLSLAFPLLWVACGTVPISGRKSLNLVPESQIIAQSAAQYTEYVRQMPHSDDPKQVERVREVCQRVADAATSYLRKNNLNDLAQQMKWEFTVIADRRVNAFCMPGGKIVVYEGLLPYTQNEASLAIVLGHEIAHAVAKHSAEQITKQMNQQIGTSVLGTVLNSTVGGGVGDIASQVASGVFSFRNLKYSRDNESEADYMGLIFAAMAGYDPANAVTFWQRMASATNGSRAEVLSDHPSDERRIANIKKWLPEAEKYYHGYRPQSVSSTSSVRTLHIGSGTTNRSGKRR